MTTLDATLLHSPTIGGGRVVFLHAGEFWQVDQAGGEARRLLAHAAAKVAPMLSPDGAWLAYSANSDGRMSVFVLPMKGGEPRRLTVHGSHEIVRGWSRDGRRVIFASTRDVVSHRYTRLWSVAVTGGYPEPLPMPMADRGCVSPDGRRIAYTRMPEAFGSWKGYRGGMTDPIRIFDLRSHAQEAVPHTGSNDTSPCWMGGTIFFLSDRHGCMNVFACDARSLQVSQVTRHRDFDVRTLAGADGVLVYAQAGRLHRLDAASQRTEILPVRLAHDAVRRMPRVVQAQHAIRSAALSPTGMRAVFEARGEILSVPAKKGDTRNLTGTVDVHERSPAWSPDGTRIAYFSDAGGEYRLHIRDQHARGEAQVIALGGPTFFHAPLWSPDGSRIAYTDKRLQLSYVRIPRAGQKVRAARPVLVDTDTYDHPFRTLDPNWSPDGAWLAYTKRLDNHLRAVFLHHCASGRSTQITDGESDCISARFSLDGKHLYFAASTDAALRTGWLDMSSYQRPVNRSLYVVVLAKDQPSPLAPESDDEVLPPAALKPDDKPSPTPVVRVDLPGIQSRILALPVPARDYQELGCAADGRLFYLETVPNQAERTLQRFDLKERKAEPFIEKVQAYCLAQQGRHLLWRGQAQTWAIVKTDVKPAKADEGALDLGKMQVHVDPKAEWRQMFEEAWRIQRDYFYDPHMHGVDWKAVRAKYLPFVEQLADRADLNWLISEMVGELVVGHAYVWGGDQPPGEVVPIGHLGADYRIVDGRYRIERILQGLNWHPELRSPLTGPGIDVRAGDFLLAINGKELRAPTDVHELLMLTADRQTEIEVNRSPSRTGARRVTVVPVAGEVGLRHWAWVEGSRALVDRLTRGRVAYVYMPDTAVAGFECFNRHYFSQLNREGVIIDERFNGGGHVADYIIDMLSRPVLSRWATREGKIFSTPLATINGPKAMIMNEFSGSGGDGLPLYFRRRGLGPLIGKRTWGGLVGIYDYPVLMDGGVVTAPRMAIVSPDGEWEVENVGVSPDVEVEMTPKLEIAGRDPQLERAIAVVLSELGSARRPRDATTVPSEQVQVCFWRAGLWQLIASSDPGA